MPAVVDDLSEDVKGLCKYLAGKPQVAVEDLPKNLQSPAVIAKALVKGLAEIGRKHYSETIKNLTVKKEKGQPVIDEAGRQVVVKEIEVSVGKEWSWTTLNSGSHKPLAEVLKEDESLPDSVKLHVRLTSAGLAATA